MSSVEFLRQFLCERLSAAAEEIFGVVVKTIVEYEEEINRQRKLLEVVPKPRIQLYSIDCPQQQVREEEEVLTEQHLCIQESTFSQEQPEPPQLQACEQEEDQVPAEQPEPPQVQEEQEVCTSQEELKQESEAFILTNTNGESDQSEAELKIEPTLFFLLHDSHAAEGQEQGGDEQYILWQSPDPEGQSSEVISCSSPTLRKSLTSRSDHESGLNAHPESQEKPPSPTQNSEAAIQTEETLYQCETCGKKYSFLYLLKRHMVSHTEEKQHHCKVCGKSFKRLHAVKAHMKVHSVEKLHHCKVCGRNFKYNHILKRHLLVHTGEKPYSCGTCGKEFRTGDSLKLHNRVHTGEKPYVCEVCQRRFSQLPQLKRHSLVHTGDNPHTCKICGKGFRVKWTLASHMRNMH